MENRVEKAVELFKNGYNCAQAVFTAYADLYNIDEETALRLSTAFGGGMGGLRETCGAVSGMTMIVGLKEGVYIPYDKEGKKRNYEIVQLLANEFKQENGSIICKHLLGLEEGLPADKQKKPCAEYVRICAELIAKHIVK
ncbi:MAG: C-GCAxxG-C-C family protein [Dysgonomonas sp.]